MALDVASSQKTLETPRDTVAPARPGLDRVIEKVADDSRREPDQYLDEVVVPFGGE